MIPLQPAVGKNTAPTPVCGSGVLSNSCRSPREDVRHALRLPSRPFARNQSPAVCSPSGRNAGASFCRYVSRCGRSASEQCSGSGSHQQPDQFCELGRASHVGSSASLLCDRKRPAAVLLRFPTWKLQRKAGPWSRCGIHETRRHFQRGRQHLGACATQVRIRRAPAMGSIQ